MRRLSLIAALAVAASACASSSSTTNEAAGPAPAAAATAAVGSGGATPCANGGCRITVEIPDEIRQEFTRRQASFRVIEGCPRQFGSVQTAKAIVTQATPILSIPAGPTRIATVALFFGSRADSRTITVDLSQNPTPTVNFGYLWGGNSLTDNSTVVLTNRTTQQRICSGR